MRVRDLIAELEKHDPDAKIVLAKHKGGYYSPHWAGSVDLILNVHREWNYGPHELSSWLDNISPQTKKTNPGPYTMETAILIGDVGNEVPNRYV